MGNSENEIDVRKRRALFRANHRGTKEMDWMLGKYADANLAIMDEYALAEFEKLLAISDPELQKWLLDGQVVGGEFAPLIEQIRHFHGLSLETSR